MGLLIIGLQKLRLSRHPKVRRIVGLCVMAYFLGLSVLFVILLTTKMVAASNVKTLYHHPLALLAVSPIILYVILALYMIRRRVKSNSQLAITNAP
jgi:hypothetical protein